MEINIRDELQCGSCKSLVEISETHYHCPVCAFAMCEPCYFEEEYHAHDLTRVKGALAENIKFVYKDPRTQHHVLIGEYPTALPDSRTIRNNSVKSVLSILTFDGTRKLQGMEKLAAVYPTPADSSVASPSLTSFARGVLYHLLPVQDFSDPDKMKNYSLPSLLGEATVFIDEALKRGNVLVHCERGQRRSPTLVLAWLIAHGKTTDEALARINRGYLVESAERLHVGEKEWAKGYKKTRSKWVLKLRRFERKAKVIREFWTKSNQKAVEGWQSVFARALKELNKLQEEGEEKEGDGGERDESDGGEEESQDEEEVEEDIENNEDAKGEEKEEAEIERLVEKKPSSFQPAEEEKKEAHIPGNDEEGKDEEEESDEKAQEAVFKDVMRKWSKLNEDLPDLVVEEWDGSDDGAEEIGKNEVMKKNDESEKGKQGTKRKMAVVEGTLHRPASLKASTTQQASLKGFFTNTKEEGGMKRVNESDIAKAEAKRPRIASLPEQ